jgi:phage repressor protein C with HTH and peptisase S24 domain
MMDQPHDILRKARIKKGYESAEAAAKAYGWNVTTYRSHENGIRGVRGIPKEAAKRYAAAFNIPVWQLIDVDNHSTSTSEVTVIGDAAFGVWRTNALDREHTKNRKSLSAPSLSSEGKMRFAIRIADDSVNKLLQPGQFAIFVTPSEPIKNNSLVVVERTRSDLVERTVRRYVAGKPSPKLVSYSTSPMYQETLQLSDGQNGSDTVKIIGLVVGTHSDYPEGLIVT